MEQTTGENLVSKIMDFEEGQMDFEEAIEFFQYLIDTGMAWRLQGTYGRIAGQLIERGLCTQREG